MRKALIGFVLAATVLTPAAALAQRHGRGGDDNEARAEQRAERVQQRSEARQQRQEARQQQAPQQQAAPQPPQQQQYVQRSRGGDGNRGDGNRSWRGNDGNRGGNANDGNRNWRGGGGDRGGRGAQQQSVYPQAWQGNPNDPRLQHYRELERRNQQQGNRGDWRRDRRDDRRDDRQDWRRDRRDDNRGDWRGDRRGDRRDWNRDWRNDRRYDWRSWRNSNRNIFRGSRYYSPYRDWSYNRFSIGVFLEPLFYSRNYWIGDPWQYRLPPAYPGTQWVRYYNDVLLVDVYSGEVLDVIYDFFW